ncbi:MAG: biotin transporter BioY [Bacilli bacterium]|nr:biotin transporter BioY [Bacilli bacterium]
MNKKIKDIAIISVAAAMICVLSPISIPIGDVPISLATFIIYLIVAILGPKKGTISVLVYILVGIIGVPVFSNYRAGISVIVGVTGGYIVGYIPLALLTGIFTYKFKNKIWMYPIGMILGTIVCYFIGTVWYMFNTNNNLISSLLVCVVPFLLFDLIKIVLSSVLAYLINKKLSL